MNHEPTAGMRITPIVKDEDGKTSNNAASEKMTPGQWQCKCVYEGIRVTHTTGTYCGQCDEDAPGVWKTYSGQEVGDGKSSVAIIDGFEYDISHDRHGKIFLTVRMPNGFQWTSQSLRNIETAKIGAKMHHEAFKAVVTAQDSELSILRRELDEAAAQSKIRWDSLVYAQEQRKGAEKYAADLQINLATAQGEIKRLREARQWISIYDRLPDFKGTIYSFGVDSDREPFQQIEFWMPEKPWFTREGVTHWMPALASPAKEQGV